MYSVEGGIEGLFDDFLSRHKLGPGYVQTAQQWFVPLAESMLVHQKGAVETLFVGVNGSQGSGKSTLCDFLLQYLTTLHDLNVISLSLDDFYFSSEKRAQLARDVHPLLATRGVPGTHDVACMAETFAALKAKQTPVIIPRFDKASDNPCSREEWLTVTRPVDIVLMEGWCWGITAQDQSELTHPVNDLEANEDADASWRQFVNQSLVNDYVPLYEYMQFWVMLKAPDFGAVHGWRSEQEQKLREKLATENADTEALAGLMTDEDIEYFIAHYQRLTEHGLATLPESCDALFELDYDRTIAAGRLGR